MIKKRNLSILFDERQINMYNKGEDESFWRELKDRIQRKKLFDGRQI